MIGKDLEMIGIVKAIAKKQEPEDSLNHVELQSSYVEKTLGKTLHEIRTSICLTEFVLFSHRYYP